MGEPIRWTCVNSDADNVTIVVSADTTWRLSVPDAAALCAALLRALLDSDAIRARAGGGR